MAIAFVVMAPGAASAQARPCVYHDTDGRIVITDRLSDPRCAHLRPRPAAASRATPRRISLATAELVDLTHRTALEFGVDHRLIESVVEMESAYNPRAVSRTGAMGLMQLMPDLARQYGVRNAFDARENLRTDILHMRALLRKYESDVRLTLAAYNAGEGSVKRYGGVPPFRETLDYVARVLARYRQRVRAET